jgi:hypothetical protein
MIFIFRDEECRVDPVCNSHQGRMGCGVAPNGNAINAIYAIYAIFCRLPVTGMEMILLLCWCDGGGE